MWGKFFKGCHSKLSFGSFPVLWNTPWLHKKQQNWLTALKSSTLNIYIYAYDNLEIWQSYSL